MMKVPMIVLYYYLDSMDDRMHKSVSSLQNIREQETDEEIAKETK